ncbi:MAG: BBP7 family outer membrane beta-barrel protein [Gemmataceae bacterium]|nr:BBP7 family outer membrane beta-barrel protein [Gemmataceae bacterium]
MTRRTAPGVGLALAAVLGGAARGQPPDADRPTELPPLLPVPGAEPPPAPHRGPAGGYDHGYFYLPDRAPEGGRDRDPACGPAGRFWVASDLALGWTRGANVPGLVRIGTPTGPVGYGGQRAGAPFRAGLGLSAGLWLDEQHLRGVDASFYYLSQGGTNATLFPPGVSLFLPTAEGTFPLSDPDAGYVGAFQAGLNTRFASADVNYRRNLLCSADARLDALAGYRYAHVADDFEVYGKRLGPAGQIVRFRDQAGAENDFHGGQVGLAGEYRAGSWYAGMTGKVAFGTVFTDTSLEGKFRVDGTVIPSGFYARPGLSGDRDHTRFGVLPAVGVTVGRQLGDHARLFVGYSFLYLNHLTRGPDVIDPAPPVSAADPFRVNPVGANRRDAADSDFWAQSVNLGLELRY